CLRTWSASAWPWSICRVMRECPGWRLGPTEIPRTWKPRRRMTPETLVSVFCPSTTSSDKTRTLFTSPPCGEVGPDREAVPAGWGLFTSPPCGEVGPDREAVPAGWGLTTAEGRLISSIFRGLPELAEPLAERNDRIHVGLGVDAEVDQERALRPLRRIERGRDVLELIDPHRGQPVRLAELHEVRHVREVDLRAD